MAAQDGGADAEPLRKLGGAGLPLPHEPEDALQRNPGVLSAEARRRHASDHSLEVEDAVDKVRCGVRGDCHD